MRFVRGLPELLRDLVGPGQRGGVLVGVDLAAQAELEALEAFGNELLQTRQLLDVLIRALVLELPQRADDLVELARIDVLATQHAAERVGILRVLTRLTAQLPDVFLGETPAVPPAAPCGIAAGPRTATIEAATQVAASVCATAVTAALAGLTRAALTALAFLALALLTVLALAVLCLLALTLTLTLTLALTLALPLLAFLVLAVLAVLALLAFPALFVGGMGQGDVKMQMGFGSWVGALYGAHEGGWTIVYAVCTGMIIGGVIGLAMMLLRGQLHRNLSNIKEIFTDLRLMVTAGPQAAASRAQSRRPSWHRLPYGIPLCLGFVGYLGYLYW